MLNIFNKSLTLEFCVLKWEQMEVAMIKSMTGYGRESFLDETLSLDIEMKSVNSRYLDLSIRMPNQLNFLEDAIRKAIKNRIARGRVDLFIRTSKKNLSKSNINVDLDTALEMKEKLEAIIEHTGIKSAVNLNDILRNDDVLTYDSPNLDEEYLKEKVLATINNTLSILDTMRIQEGEHLKEALLELLGKIEDNTKKIEQLASNITSEYKEKIEASIAKLLDKTHPIDEDRLANEIVFYADRADIAEEITRLYSHIKQFNQSLNSKEAIGKKLDFITQEMLRETNTIGSKSNKREITELVIEQKTVIEKIKEQVQNIE